MIHPMHMMQGALHAAGSHSENKVKDIICLVQMTHLARPCKALLRAPALKAMLLRTPKGTPHAIDTCGIHARSLARLWTTAASQDRGHLHTQPLENRGIMIMPPLSTASL
jgi:hypothetical protein